MRLKSKGKVGEREEESREFMKMRTNKRLRRLTLLYNGSQFEKQNEKNKSTKSSVCNLRVVITVALCCDDQQRWGMESENFMRSRKSRFQLYIL